MFMVRNSFCHDLYLKRLKLRVFFAANWPPAGRPGMNSVTPGLQLVTLSFIISNV